MIGTTLLPMRATCSLDGVGPALAVMGDDVVRRKALHELELRLCLEHPQKNVFEDVLLAIQFSHDIHQAKTVFGGDGGQGLLKGLPAAGAVVFDEKSGHQAKVAG